MKTEQGKNERQRQFVIIKLKRTEAAGHGNKATGRVPTVNLTFLPALLLCRFIRDLAVSAISLASMNFRASCSPNLMSALQPPHFQPSGAKRPSRLSLSQPHCVRLPLLHACVMAYVTPAELREWISAASRLAATRMK